MKLHRKALFSGLLSLLAIAALTLHLNAIADQKNLHNEEVQRTLGVIITSPDTKAVKKAIQTLDEHWKPSFTPMTIESLAYTQDKNSSRLLLALLEKKTGKNFGRDFNQWYAWLWRKPAIYSNEYANFKANLYRNIDPKFDRYFRNRQASARIRLDEIRWGGVLQDGMPLIRRHV